MGFKFRLRSIAAVIGTMMLVPIILVGNVSARPLSKTDKDFLLKSIERAEVDSQMVSSKEGMILEANGQTYDRINNLALGKKLKVYAVCDGSECKKLSFTISDGRGSQTSSKEDQPLVGNNLKVFSAEILAESPNYDFYLTMDSCVSFNEECKVAWVAFQQPEITSSRKPLANPNIQSETPSSQKLDEKCNYVQICKVELPKCEECTTNGPKQPTKPVEPPSEIPDVPSVSKRPCDEACCEELFSRTSDDIQVSSSSTKSNLSRWSDTNSMRFDGLDSWEN